MKVSEITINDLKDYIRIDTDDENTFLMAALIGVRAYIKSYTGLDDAKMDECEDFALVIFILCSEMYDNRQFTVDKATINPIINSILDMHSINYL